MGRTSISRAALVAALLSLPVGLAVAEPVLTAVPSDVLPAGVAAERLILVTIEQQPTRGLTRAGSTPRGYRGGASYKVSPRASRIARKLARDHGLRAVESWPIELLDVHCLVYEIPEGETVSAVLAVLAADPRVESAQPLHLFEVMGTRDGPPSAERFYDDPLLHLQTGLRALQVEEAHRWATGAGVRVAVIDTGVDTTHPELESRVEAAEDFVGATSQAFLSDVHGTAVAGVVASLADNGLGIVGVAPEVEILALKACWQPEEGGSTGVCSSFTLAQAVAFAIRRRSNVLNFSLSGPSDPLLARLIDKALERGIVVVAAADPRDGLSPGFPASHRDVIAVHVSPSSADERTRSLGTIDGVGAPGLDVLTTQPRSSFGFMSGSSLAAAHVSGVAALLLQRDRKLSSAEVLALLQASTGASGRRSLDESRPVNACAALAELLGDGECRSTDG